MHGDYSRGHEPDRKRGRDYRRVLLQHGPARCSTATSRRPSTRSSDEVRATTRGLGCAAGSPDLGFLVTAGRLLGVFAEATDITCHRHAERVGRLPLPLRRALPGAATLEAAGAGAGVGDAAGYRPAPIRPRVARRALGPRRGRDHDRRQRRSRSRSRPARPTASTGSSSTPTARRCARCSSSSPPAPPSGCSCSSRTSWPAPTRPSGSRPAATTSTASSSHARGGGVFPSSAFPDAAGFPWNASPYPGSAARRPARDARDGRPLRRLPRGVGATHHRRRGPRHPRGGAGPGDTTARTELLGQVKLAQITGGGATPAALRAAFDRVESSNGGLIVDVPQSTPTTDPCALPGRRGLPRRRQPPLPDRGPHRRRALTQLRLKWSRDNGSELFAARVDESRNLRLRRRHAAGRRATSSRSSASVIDLGDDALAQVSAGGFAPARRAVGQLAQLAAVDASALSDDVAFTLVDPTDGVTPVPLSARYGTLPDAGLKLRRWHGLIRA